MAGMTIRTWKRLLVAANVILAAAVGASIWLSLVAPLAVAAPSQPKQPITASAPAGSTPGISLRDQYAVIWHRDLRGPLYDPKSSPGVAPKPQAPKLALRLTGTAVEPGHTYAFFQNAKGQTKMLSMGQTIDGAEVIAIDTHSTTVRFHGEEIRFTVEKDKP